MARLFWMGVLVAALGCRGRQIGPTIPASEADTDTDTDTDTDADADTDADSDTDADTDVPLCDDDQWEVELDTGNPDEDITDAVQLSSNELREELMLTPASSQDYWRFPLSENQTIQIDVTFAHADGDIAVELYGPDQEHIVAQADSDSDDETITYTASTSGSHYLRVHNDGSCQMYDVETDVQ